MILVLKKLMVCFIIAILFFSSLSFAFLIQFPWEQRTETKKQTFVNDDLFFSRELTIPELNGNTGEIESNMPPVTIENFNSSNFTKPQVIIENFTPSNFTMPLVIIEDSTPNSLTDIPKNEVEIPGESQASDRDSSKMMTHGVAVYSDSNFTPLSSIEWGSLEPGGKSSIECHIKNIGNKVSKLTLDTANWAPPEAADYIKVTWDYNEQKIEVGEMISISLTLHVSKKIQGITEFFFDIIILGSDV